MKPLRLFASIIMLAFFSMQSYAQDKTPVKFGKITPADFQVSGNSIDSGASAIIIADIGNSYFEGNSKGWFTLLHKHQKRVKIINKNGFEEANVVIPLYFDGRAEERLENLKAYTYNLENGKIIETKLESSSVFKDKLSKNVVVRKFTFPAVKEGSIIEFSYTVSSDFLFNLQPWSFQGEYPVLWSEYTVSIPDFFNYVYLGQGYQPFFIKDSRNDFRTFNITEPGTTAGERNENFSISGNVASTRWVMKDVPSLKKESYTSTLKNHISKVEFQLSQYRFPQQPVKNILGDWTTLSTELLKDEDFGESIGKNNNWLDDDLKIITAGASNLLEKAERIYAYVRDNFTCTDHDARSLSNPLKTVFKAKNGKVSDINLLLVAMLRHENIEADPVLLSTRDHGFINEFYPLLNRFNYVIAEARINDTPIYLDASHTGLGFGKLDNDCYNGCARVISPQPRAAYFMADSLIEKKVTSYFMVNDEKEGLKGTMQARLGYFESLDIREKIKSAGQETYFKQVNSGFGDMLQIEKPGIDSLKKLEQPVIVHYDFKMKFEEDMVYFNPLMAEGLKENLLKAAERKYPVEMPYATDETFILTMEIPNGYTVEELPKSARVSFNDGEGMFEYMIGNADGRIQLRSRIVIKKANFSSDEYEPLRGFFGHIVKKHSEQIVFKKKKA